MRMNDERIKCFSFKGGKSSNKGKILSLSKQFPYTLHEVNLTIDKFTVKYIQHTCYKSS